MTMTCRDGANCDEPGVVCENDVVNLPMPNERFGESTVVASTWLRDDVPNPFALLLLLGEAPPFYTIVQVTWNGRFWDSGVAYHHENIVPAVSCYEDNGGDY